MKRLILYIAGLIFLAGCSTTKHLPEGEILYTGQKPMIVLNRSEPSVGEIAMEEVEAALATAPNNSLLGSSLSAIPFLSDCGFTMVSRSMRRDSESGYSINLPPLRCLCLR